MKLLQRYTRAERTSSRSTRSRTDRKQRETNQKTLARPVREVREVTIVYAIELHVDFYVRNGKNAIGIVKTSNSHLKMIGYLFFLFHNVPFLRILSSCTESKRNAILYLLVFISIFDSQNNYYNCTFHILVMKIKIKYTTINCRIVFRKI